MGELIHFYLPNNYWILHNAVLKSKFGSPNRALSLNIAMNSRCDTLGRLALMSGILKSNRGVRLDICYVSSVRHSQTPTRITWSGRLDRPKPNYDALVGDSLVIPCANTCVKFNFRMATHPMELLDRRWCCLRGLRSVWALRGCPNSNTGFICTVSSGNQFDRP